MDWSWITVLVIVVGIGLMVLASRIRRGSVAKETPERRAALEREAALSPAQETQGAPRTQGGGAGSPVEREIGERERREG